MPLNATLSNILEQMAAANTPPLESMTPADARQFYLALRPMAGEPEPVGEVAERKIPGPGGDIPVRIYKPEGPGPFPMLVYLHGGGFVIGSIETHDPLCRLLTNAAGCITVSVDYRLAPEHRFPAGLNDAYAATAWASANATILGGQNDLIAVGGDSAGGNLATGVARMARDKGTPPILYQLLIYPGTDWGLDRPSYVENGEGYFLTKNAVAWFWSQYVEDEADRTDPLASPLRAEDLSNLPPALVVTAEFDPLRDEGEAYALRLQEAGVAVDAIRYDGMIHGFFQMTGVLGEARTAVDAAAAKLRAAFAS